MQTLFGDEFRTVLCDPPWQERGAGKIKRGADRYYELLPLAGILAAMRGAPCWQRVAKDAHLWVWATSSHLPEALALIESLGFRYVSHAVWVKMKSGGLQIGLGQYMRHAHEHLLLATRGRACVPPPSRRPPSVIRSMRREHSRKPDQQYDHVELVSPGPYLEMFARGYPRAGWTSWGDEAEGGE